MPANKHSSEDEHLASMAYGVAYTRARSAPHLAALENAETSAHARRLAEQALRHPTSEPLRHPPTPETVGVVVEELRARGYGAAKVAAAQAVLVALRAEEAAIAAADTAADEAHAAVAAVGRQQSDVANAAIMAYKVADAAADAATEVRVRAEAAARI